MRVPISISENMRPIMAAIQSVSHGSRPHAEQGEPPAPFLTLSRQPGAGAWTLARKFVEQINADQAGGPRWTCWDRELVEKVAADHNLSERLIESFEDIDHSWLTGFLNSLTAGGNYDDLHVYRRVAATVRALAQAGHVVIVGLGSPFITRTMPGGIHLRLVAPLEHRINTIQRTMNMSRQQATAWVARAEDTRAGFYKHFWPKHSLAPEEFTLTINTSCLDSDQIIKMLRALVEAPRPVAAARA